MSDDAPKNVTATEFNRFLAAKAPEKPCPECGVLRWTVSSASSKEPEDTRVFKAALTNFVDVLEVYPMACQNCGFIKNYSAVVVENWVKENG